MNERSIKMVLKNVSDKTDTLKGVMQNQMRRIDDK